MLPPEVWEQVFQHLSPRHLCQLALVCRHLHHLLSQAKFWSSARLRARHMEGGGPRAFLQSPRYSAIRHLTLTSLGEVDPSSWLTIFLSLPRLPSLTSLDLSHNTFTRVAALSKLPLTPHLNMSYCRLTQAQLELLWSKICLSPSRHTIILKNMDCTRVPPLLLEQAVASLAGLHLGQGGRGPALTPRQANALLAAVASTASTRGLASLSLAGTDLSSTSGHLLARCCSLLFPASSLSPGPVARWRGWT